MQHFEPLAAGFPGRWQGVGFWCREPFGEVELNNNIDDDRGEQADDEAEDKVQKDAQDPLKADNYIDQSSESNAEFHALDEYQNFVICNCYLPELDSDLGDNIDINISLYKQN